MFPRVFTFPITCLIFIASSSIQNVVVAQPTVGLDDHAVGIPSEDQGMKENCASWNKTDVIIVNTDIVLRQFSTNPTGINFNYLRDDNSNRPRGAPTIQAVMKQMNVQWIRYPGGEKSDWHFFAKPPYDHPDPQVFGWYRSQVKDVLDFDEYTRYVREFEGIPFVVVPYESEERSGKTKEEFLQHAIAWVRYANITQRYDIQYWEIGNENWHHNTATEIAQIAKEFSRAMKAVDPTIKVGCSGNTLVWFQTLLGIAGKHLDFLTVSNYHGGGWEGFKRYQETENMALDGPARHAAQAVAESPYYDRIEVVVAEYNACDWKGTWAHRNDLGHAIVSFDIAGQLFCNNRVKCAMLWTTRYMGDANPVKIWFALGAQNELLPAGRSLAIWSTFLKSQMVKVSGPERTRCFASFEPRSTALTVFVINKDEGGRKVRMEIKTADHFHTADVYHFSGKGEADMSPAWSKVATAKLSENAIPGVDLPGTSITVVDMRVNNQR